MRSKLMMVVGSLVLTAALVGVAWLDAGRPALAERPAPASGAAAGQAAAPLAATVSVHALSDTVEVGQVFTVAIRLDTPDTPVSAFQFDLGYNPAVVAYVGSAPGAVLESTGRVVVCPPAAQAAGLVRLACASTGAAPGASEAGVLAVLTMQASGDGQSPLALANVQVVDDAFSPGLLDVTLQNDSVQVGIHTLFLPLVVKNSAPQSALSAPRPRARLNTLWLSSLGPAAAAGGGLWGEAQAAHSLAKSLVQPRHPQPALTACGAGIGPGCPASRFIHDSSSRQPRAIAAFRSPLFRPARAPLSERRLLLG